MQMPGQNGAPSGADYSSSDAEFMRRMVPHHRMAVSMAAAAYSHAKNPFVRDFALKIFAAQREEIEIMERWLAYRGLKPHSSM